MESKRSKLFLVALMTSGLLCGSAFVALAADDAKSEKFDYKKGVEESPFEACKDVALVKHDSFKENEAQWKKMQKDCGADRVQFLPKTGFLTLAMKDRPDQSVVGALSNLAFLEKVAEKTKDNLEGNIAMMNAIEACLKDKAKAGAALSSLGKWFKKPQACDSIISDTRETLKKVAPELRFELGHLKDLTQTTGKFDARQAFEKADGAYFVQRQVGGGGSAKGVIRVSMDKLADKEFDAVKASIGKELAEIRSEWDSRTEKSLAERKAAFMKNGGTESEWKTEETKSRQRVADGFQSFAQSKLEEKHAEHQAKYIALLGQAPLLSVMGNVDPSDKELLEGYQKLRASAESELKRVKETLAKGASYSVSNDSAKKSGEKDKAQNLLTFMSNLPVVEQVLAEHKLDCATATGLMNYASSDKLRGGIMQGALWMVPYAGVGKVARLVGSAGTILTAERAGVLMGAALGAGATGYYGYLAQKETTETLEGAQAGTKTFKQYSEVQDSIVGVLAFAPLDFIGLGSLAGGGAGYASTKIAKHAAAKNLAKKGYDADKAAALIKAANAGDKRSQKILTDILGADAKRIFGIASPSKQELALAEALDVKGLNEEEIASFFTAAGKAVDKAERKSAVVKASQLLEKFQPEKTATPEQKKEATKALLAYSRLDVKEPDQLLAAAMSYPETSLKGMQKAAQEGSKILKDPKKSAALRAQVAAEAKAAGISDPDQIRGMVASRAYKEGTAELRSGKPYAQLIPDDKKIIDDMCVCAGMCSVGKKGAALETLSPIELAALPSCLRPKTPELELLTSHL